MICQKCGLEFEDKDIQESHDVPCYIFAGEDRKEKKNQADKHGRHLLCKKCHDIYEKCVFSAMVFGIDERERNIMINLAKLFAMKYFGGWKGG